MRIFFKILILTLLSLSLKAQSPSGLPAPYSTGYYRIGWIQSDSGTIAALRDTTVRSKYIGLNFLWLHSGMDSSFWFWNGLRYIKSLNTQDTLPGRFLVTQSFLGNQGYLKNITGYIQAGANISFGGGSGTLLSPYIISATGGGSPLATASGDASGTVSGTNLPLTLATVNSNVGTFGDAAHSADFTVDAKGRITGAGQTAIQITESQVTNLTSDLAGKQASITTGSTSQYFRGDLSLATFPTNLSSFTNGPGYITANQPISFTASGDVTGTYTNPTTLSPTLTLKNTGIGSGSCTNCNVTVDAQGRVTNYANGSGGTGGTNSNVGAGYRFAVPGTNNIKTLFCSGCTLDSSSNANGITLTVTGGGGVATASGDASGTVSGTNLPLTLATVNSNVGTFGSASSVAQITTNAKGLTTAASSVSIQISESQVTNLTSDLAGKQATGNYITSLTGDITGTGPGATATTLKNTGIGSGSCLNCNVTIDAQGRVTNYSNGSGGTGGTNSNIGSGYRFAVPGTNNIKTLFCSGCTLDSTTNTNALTLTVTGGLTTASGDASGTVSGTNLPLTLATVNTNTGSFGTASNVGTFTVNGKGLITAASNTPIQITESQVTNLTTDLGNKLSTTLPSGDIFVGNGSNVATGVPMTGDVGISNAGLTTIQPNVVTYAKIQAAVGQGLIGAQSAGNFQFVTLGTNLSMTGGVLNATGGTSGITLPNFSFASNISGSNNASIDTSYYRIFNVLDFPGIKGDSVTDITIPFRNMLARLPRGAKVYLPAGDYIFTDTIAIRQDILIEGDGMQPYNSFTLQSNPHKGATNIYYNSGSKNLFVCDSSATNVYPVFEMRDLSIINTSSTKPSGGAAIQVNRDLMQWELYRVCIQGFYMGVQVISGDNFMINNCRILAPVKWGIVVGNNRNVDAGGWHIINTYFMSGPTYSPDSASGLYIRGNGAGYVDHCFFNAMTNATPSYTFQYGIYTDFADGATSDFFFTNLMFENFQNGAIKMRNRSGGVIRNIHIDNIHISPVNNTGSALSAIDISNFSTLSIDHITAINYLGPILHPLIRMDSCTSCNIGQITYQDWNAQDSVTNATALTRTVIGIPTSTTSLLDNGIIYPVPTNNTAVDSVGIAVFYNPAGPNSSTFLSVSPHGVGSIGIPAQIALQATDTKSNANNFESLVIRSPTAGASSPFKIFTTNNGAGNTLDPISIYTGTNTTQIQLLTNGNTSFGGQITSPTNLSITSINTKVLFHTTTDNGLAGVQINSKLSIANIDSTTTPVNMLYQDVNGLIKKAAVPAGGSVPAATTTVSGIIKIDSVTLKYNGSGQLTDVAASPAGANFQLQYYNGGFFGATSLFSVTPSTGVMNISPGSNSLGGITINGTAIPAIIYQNGGTNESVLGLATAANNLFTGAATNDFIIRSNANNLLLGAGTSNKATLSMGTTYGIKVFNIPTVTTGAFSLLKQADSSLAQIPFANYNSLNIDTANVQVGLLAGVPAAGNFFTSTNAGDFIIKPATGSRLILGGAGNIKYSLMFNGTTAYIQNLVASVGTPTLLVQNTDSSIRRLVLSGFTVGSDTLYAPGGSGAVSSVSNSDGTLTISPTTGAVVASLALGHANTWTGGQTFGALTTTGALTFTGLPSKSTALSTDSVLIENVAGTVYKLPVPSGGGSGVTSVGTFSGSSQTNGASISGTTITFGPADATNPGMIKATGSQTLGATLTMPAPLFSGLASAGINDSVLTVDPSTGQVHRRSGTFNLYGGQAIKFTGGDTVNWGGTLTGPDTIYQANNPITISGGQFTLGNLLATRTWNPNNAIPGSIFSIQPGTLNDATTSASGTISNVYVSGITGVLLTATNTAVTYTNAFNLYINQGPTASTNVTVSHSYGLGVSGYTWLQSNTGIGITPNSSTVLALSPATTSSSSLNINSSATINVTSPVSGDVWWNGTNLYFYDGSVKRDLLAGIRNYQHTIFTPTAASTTNLINNQYNIINPATGGLSFTLNLPSSPNNNDCVYVKFDQTATVVTYANGTVVGGISAPVAGQVVVFVYDSGSSTWY